MFRMSYNFWKSLICIVNTSLEQDVTTASFFNVFRKQFATIILSNEGNLFCSLLNPTLGAMVLWVLCTGTKIHAKQQCRSEIKEEDSDLARCREGCNTKIYVTNPHTSPQLTISLFFCQGFKLLTYSWIFYLFKCLNV